MEMMPHALNLTLVNMRSKSLVKAVFPNRVVVMDDGGDGAEGENC